MTAETEIDHARVRARRLRRGLRYLAVALAALGAVVFFVFVSASANSRFFEQNYTALLWLNAGLLAALFLTVLVLAFRLWQRWRARRFGARLMARLALMFALIGLVPGTLIYAVSVQFLARSLESWFNPRIDAALEAGIDLGRSALDAFKSDVAGKARAIALELADQPPATVGPVLNRLRDQAQVSEAAVFSSNGRVLASAGGGIALLPDVPTGSTLSRLRITRSLVLLEGDPSGDAAAGGPLRVRALVAIPRSTSLGLETEQRFLQIVQPVAQDFAQNAQSVETVYQDYRQLSLARKGLRQIFAITLTMALLLAAFAAMVAALLLATRFARPLLVLAEGTRAVAGGDYRPLPDTGTKDEIGALTQSFNAMTTQLSEARAQVLVREQELERANNYLSSVLANISTGVLVFDQRFGLLTANAAATRILGSDTGDVGHQPIEALPTLGTIAADVRAQFDTLGLAAHESAWQHQFEIDRGEGGVLVLLARGSRLALADGVGYVIVFDDISEVISAQRAVAWSEVARRLAHEIKNPLTPIQLSAERLEKKLVDKLAPDDAAVLRRGATTIVAQVAAMKHMVDEFREYARMPSAQPMPLDLNRLVEEVLSLYAGAERGLRIELEHDLPRIEGDATQLRQVIHNLLQNAQDAVDSRLQAGGSDDTGKPRIVVRTREIEYAAADGNKRVAVRLEVQDRGTGFSAKVLHRAFEPYVTTKSRGTGLGLAIVRKIAEEHGARVEVANVESGGALVGITFFRLA